MSNSVPLLKLVALAAARPMNPQHSYDFNALAVAARTTDAWHLYIAFRYDTSSEGGLPGACSIILPEAEEEDVLRILRSGLELGGYRLGGEADLTDLTELLGPSERLFLALQEKHDDPLFLARIIAEDGAFEIRTGGSLIELRGTQKH